MIENFQSYWDKANDHDSPDDVRQQLIAKIVDRVFVYDSSVIAIALHGDFGIVLDNTTLVPNEVLEGISEEIEKGANPSEKVCTHDGSDGDRVRACIAIRLIPPFDIQAQYKISLKLPHILKKQGTSFIYMSLPVYQA